MSSLSLYLCFSIQNTVVYLYFNDALTINVFLCYLSVTRG